MRFAGSPLTATALTSRIRPVGVLVALAIALATLAGAGAAGAATVAPYGHDDYGGFRDVLPPGTNGLDNAAQLAAFEAVGARPAHNDDQLSMYSNLLWAAPGLSAADVGRYFKDATFGVPPGQAESSESPEAGVTIVRDKAFGVPHIYGDTRAALMFGVGYATAEDRLFFIDVLRHLGRAQLTSFAGGAPANRAFDAMQWSVAPYTEADRQAQVDRGVALADGPLGQHTSAGSQAGAEARQILADSQSFVAGINAYIAQAKLNPQLMPGEYAAIGQSVQPFGLTDLVAIASLVGGIFGTGGGEQLPWAQLLQDFQARFGEQAGYRNWLDLRSLEDPEAPTTVHGARFPYASAVPAKVAPGSVAMPDPGSVTYPPIQTVTGGGSSSSSTAAASTRRPPSGLPGLLALPANESNALVVSASKSASGHPLAVFGPQVGYFAPQILMEEDLHGPGIDAAGAAFPGVNQYVELGHGRDYAWSATSAGQDIIGTFALALCDPAGGTPSTQSNSYQWQGQCVAMDKLQQVNNWTPNAADSTPSGSETLTAYRTRMGLVEARATIGGKPVVYVLDRSTYGHELDSALGFEEFNDPGFVQDARSFQRAAFDIGYTFNWFYADSQHIAYFNSGEDPIRAPGTNPLLPVWGSFPWQGFDPTANTADYLPFDDHPQAIDQPFFTSWNNKPAPGYGDYDAGPVYRSQLLDDRVTHDLAGGAKLTLPRLVGDMEDAGTVDLRADKVLPYALQILGEPSDPSLRAAVDALRAWVADGSHRKPPAPGQPYAHADAIRILDAWWPLLAQAVYQPTMGQQLFDDLKSPPGISNAPPGAGALDNPPNNNGDHLGSAWDGYFYGHIQKDLRQVLGLPVAAPDSQVYCGGGTLDACRAALSSSLAQAVAEPSARVYPADGVCESGDQTCFDAIRFRPLGAVTQPLIPWVNRPTFQQADEIEGHRPFPPEPACIYDNVPAATIGHARASRRRRIVVKGSARPRDCGVAPARLTAVSVSVTLRVRGGCRFVGPHGRLTKARACGRPLFLPARGTAHWALHIHRRLPRGRYVIEAQALDASGDVARAAAPALRVR
jgi:acyl-homoserine lactone acylase PvdQ